MNKCVAFENIPRELHPLKGWLLWKFVQKPGKTKPDKIPYYVSGDRRKGKQGSPEDRAQLVTFEQAVAAFKRGGFDGIGFAVFDDWGLVFLDFDKCVKNGILDPAVSSLVEGTYAEFSPSGNGIRAIMRGETGNNKSGATDDHFGFETFHSSGFVTITGNVIPECEILADVAPLSDGVRQLCKKRFGDRSKRQYRTKSGEDDAAEACPRPTLGLSLAELRDHLSYLDPDMGRDDWIKVGMALHHETSGSDDGEALFVDWSRGDLKRDKNDVE